MRDAGQEAVAGRRGEERRIHQLGMDRMGTNYSTMAVDRHDRGIKFWGSNADKKEAGTTARAVICGFQFIRQGAWMIAGESARVSDRVLEQKCGCFFFFFCSRFS